MSSRIWLEINLSTIRENFQSVQRAVAPLQVMAVLKANAYGLGAEQVGKVLVDAGADAIGIAEPSELFDTTARIQILGSILPEEIPFAITNKITLPIASYELACQVNEVAENFGIKAQCQFILDTGMGRLGLANKVKDTIIKCYELPYLEFSGIYSHFPVAYENRHFSLQQIESFKTVIGELKESGLSFKHYHIANSDGINNLPEACQHPFSMVRCGINLYGIHEISGATATKIKPAIALKSKLIEIRTLKAGTTIGYGQTYRLPKEMKVGTIPAGYADGVPLALSNRGFVMINNVLCPIIGRISMDYLTVSLEPLDDPKIGELVTLIGSSSDFQITVEDWAHLANTSPYQIICGFGQRVKRTYL